MLEKYAELKQLEHERDQLVALIQRDAQRQILELKAQDKYKLLDSLIDEERTLILHQLHSANVRLHTEELGKIEVRSSAPKYIIFNDSQVLLNLIKDADYQALQIKKNELNKICKDRGGYPGVDVIVEDELAITLTGNK